MKNLTTILAAVGALLLGSGATAMLMKGNNTEKAPEFVELVNVAPEKEKLPVPLTEEEKLPAALPEPLAPVAKPVLPPVANVNNTAPSRPAVLYADILSVNPISNSEPRYATITNIDPINENTTVIAPQEICEDVVVQERLPERDGNTGGTVVGALVGGLIANQIGRGNGKKAATAAGAVVGGIVGNQIDKRGDNGRVINRTERQCHTENRPTASTQIVGYHVTYRNADGTTGTKKLADKPSGSRIEVGTSNSVSGYNVTYRFQGRQKTIQMAQRPSSNRLPVIDGKVVTQMQ